MEQGQLRRQFRSDNGKVSSGMFKGARLLLLTTTGANIGNKRINPFAFTRDGDNYVIIASKGRHADASALGRLLGVECDGDTRLLNASELGGDLAVRRRG
jgi:hypothetical protein